MRLLKYTPDQASYSVNDSINRISTNYGLAGKHRRNLLNASRTVTAEWQCSKVMYDYITQCYRAFIASGGVPFYMQMMLDDTRLSLYKCAFVAGSFALNRVQGETFFVKATLKAEPVKYDVINKDWTNDDGLTRSIGNLPAVSFAATIRPITFKLSHIHSELAPISFALTPRQIDSKKLILSELELIEFDLTINDL